ncbi:sel1 repeat family protein [bacterium]|nr:sel1 repeat family protein [bacterium]
MNVNRCVSLLKLAAEAGHIEAMISLAEFYGGDLGIAADPEKALHWLSLAADRGSDRADELLGRMCGALGEEE